MFGAPWWLLGVAAGAAPIIIHLLNRQRFKRVTWAAMDWLLKALERNRRRMRVENLVLLILRVLIVVLVALALSRPILESSPAAALVGGARVCRIFVIDNSYSMGVKIAATSPLERAKRSAMDQLISSQGGDVASLVISGGESAEVTPEPTGDVARLTRQIEELEISHREANLPAILSKVLAKAQGLPHPKIRVYVFTDMQRFTWVGEGKLRDPGLVDALRKARGKMGLFLVDCGRESPNTVVENVVVSADETGEAQGLVAVDVPVTVRATLEHFASEPRGDVTVKLLVDGRPEGEKKVALEARKPTVVLFPGVAFQTPGPHVLTVAADADALALDDKRNLAVDVEREVKVLCVNGSPSSDLVSNESYYLERALAPQQFEFAAGLSVFSVETATDVDFVTRNLNDYRLIVMANLFQVPPEKAPQLEAFVRRGGGLIIFLGDRTEASAWNDVMWQGGKGLLPARILERKSLPAAESAGQHFDTRRSTHEIVRTLADRSVGLKYARVNDYYYLDAREDSPDVRVLFRYDNPESSPAAVEKVYGQGRVILISTSAAARWSTFPLSPTFAPFMQELGAYAARGSTGRRNLLVGEPILTMLFPNEFGATVTVSTPRGEKLDHQPAPEQNAFRFEFSDTRTVGVYTVAFGGSRGNCDWCVSLDTRESDLERLSKADFDKLVPDHPFVFVDDPDNLRAASGRVESGAQLWKTLIYVALGLMLLELFLARYFGTQRGIVKKG